MNDQIAVLLLTSLFLTCSGDHGEEPDHIKLTLGESLTDQHASCMEYTYYSVDVVDPCKDLRVKVVLAVSCVLMCMWGSGRSGWVGEGGSLHEWVEEIGMIEF